jgi:hypothetical protein
MKNKIVQWTIGSVLLIVFAFAGAFGSCTAIADVSGEYAAKPTTLWLRLTPSAVVAIDGVNTVTLTFDFSRALDGLDADGLAKNITFEYDDYPPGAEPLEAVGGAKLTEAIYTLTVLNVPGNTGIVRVSINSPNLTPLYPRLVAGWGGGAR